MPKNKHAVKGILLLFVVFLTTVFFSNSAFAATTNGIITDANDIRWEYTLTDGSPNELTIKFYDKPVDLNRVTVPSLSELINLVPNAPANLDTYFLKSADPTAQDTAYPSVTRRQANVDTTILDMQNTSKIQIIGVKLIINPNVETELIFGPNMVIGDEEGKIIEAQVCTTMSYVEWRDTYYCGNIEMRYFPIPNWDSMTDAERSAYTPTAADINCYRAENITSLVYDASRCYISTGNWEFPGIGLVGSGDTDATNISADGIIRSGGAFSGYKLKLTNFSGSNFNYVGWFTFAHSTFNNTAITIDGNGFTGKDIFMDTNVTKAIINTNNAGTGLFRDCANLTEVEFGDGVTTIQAETFSGTGLTSMNFSNSSIKTIGARAFANAKLTSINLNGIERINYGAFTNNDITGELYMPKSINYLESALFYGNTHINKLTIAYDTLTSGTTLPLFVVFDGKDVGWSNAGTSLMSIEEVNIIAPYGENESVSATHISYNDYKYKYNYETQEYMPNCEYYTRCNGNYGYGYAPDTSYATDESGSFSGNSQASPGFVSLGAPSKFEDDYADIDSKKNVIAPMYFYLFHGIKKITIGEGYEFVGSAAFTDQNTPNSRDTMSENNGTSPVTYKGTENTGYELNFPSTLKGVGNFSFATVFSDTVDFTIPRGIEFIGIGAFRNVYFYDKDVDFPELVALGDFAFAKTRTKNVYLHDKIQYMGMKVFTGCVFIDDVTFDFDVFNPDIYVAWALPGRASGTYSEDGNFHFLAQFSHLGYDYSGAVMDLAEEEGARVNDRHTRYYARTGWRQLFGTITFTEKNVSPLPNGFNNCYYSSNSNYLGHNCPGGGSSYYDSQQNAFFANINADKIDLGKTAWKVLSPRMFVESAVGEVILPEKLEVIPGDAFSDSTIDEELIIPDTVRVIGDAAFNSAQLWWTESYGMTKEDTIKITKLPESLMYVGAGAFYGDYNLTADLNSPNLKYVGDVAFMNTRVRDVYLPSSMKMLRGGSFANVPTLRNISIDFDINSMPARANIFDEADFPQSAKDYAGENLYDFITMSSYARKRSLTFSGDDRSAAIDTFYSIFSQSMTSTDTTITDKYGRTLSGQSASGDSFGRIVFASHSVTPPSCQGYFAGLTYDMIDLDLAKWTTLSTAQSVFADAHIGTIYLPQTLTTIPNTSFFHAEITDPIDFPSNIRTIEGGSSFLESELGGLNFNEGLESIGYAAFLRAKIKGETKFPSTLRTLGTNSFQETEMAGLQIADGLEEISSHVFFRAKIDGEFALPSTLKTIGNNSFQWAEVSISNTFPEGLETIGSAAFFDTPFSASETLVIPSTVTSIGSSAFMTERADVHYDTVTVNPDLTKTNASNQLMFVMFLHVDIDKMIVNSSHLVAYDRPDAPYNEEFDGMNFEEIKITNLPKITYHAFKNCTNLKKVDFSEDANLRDIRTEAFINDSSLDTIIFSPAIKNETVTIGTNAFKNTAFTSIGDAGADFDLTAAKFDGSLGFAFANMPKVTSVKVPASFSNATIPMASFANDEELVAADIDYHITEMHNEAFSNDNKLARIFIWGNTKIYDTNLPDYDADAYGRGGDDDDEDEPTYGPTIPEGTDIYAYSTSPARYYAEHESRAGFDGTFYPLDEVLYLSSNKKKVKINDTNDDFDKDGVTLYALRRDGIILESSTWGEYDGTAFPRSTREDIHFDKILSTVAADPDFGTIWDTPVPLNELDLTTNVNFENIDYDLIMDEATEGVKLVNVKYTDKYTNYVSDTDLEPYIEELIPDGPVTLAQNVFIFFAIFAASWATVFALKGRRR